jgi:hypothetical protein
VIFEGVPSGDHECWCLLVTKETFERVTAKAPDEEFDVGPFAKPGSKYRYKIYPDDLLPIWGDGSINKDVFVISVTAVKKNDLEKA